MMEGVASEAASFAGHQMLGNLCWIYDSNRITIEGHTDLAFSDDVAARFLAYGWNVRRVGDANDPERLAQAIEVFQRTDDAPTLIIVESHIGYGAPHKHDTSAAHGEPLGEEEIRLAKRSYGWPEDAKFLVPDGVREHFQDGIGRRGRGLQNDWSTLFDILPQQVSRSGRPHRAHAAARASRGLGRGPSGFRRRRQGPRHARLLRQGAQRHCVTSPWLVGGSADLAPSTKTRLTFESAGDLEAGTPGGRNLHFGVREHAMGAILNGLAVSKMRAFGSSFLIFSDYMKPPIRLAALMELPVIYVFTHDSIGVGEDGPTHQPVEQLLALRSIPDLVTLRPADANEVVEAWRVIIGLKHRPACLALSRQALPTFDRARYAPAAGLARGAYVLADAPDGKPAVILIGTGSEVALCVEAYEALKREGIPARVVSMPSWELFEQQDQAYRDGVLPPSVTARVSVEMGSVIGWDRYVGASGTRIGMQHVRLLGPAQGSAREIRLHAGQGRCRRERADRKLQKDDVMNVQAKTKSSVSPLNRLHDYGQAVWLDFLARRFIAEGGLKKLIEQDGLTGVTSNPSIFEKAIGGSADYDASLKAAEKRGRLRCHGALRAARDRGHPACGGRAPPGLTTQRSAVTDMSASKSRRIWRWTPRRRSPRRGGFGRRSAVKT